MCADRHAAGLTRLGWSSRPGNGVSRFNEVRIGAAPRVQGSRATGGPVPWQGDFDQNAADLSVDHPGVVENYRTAHAIALREGQGSATTEELRTAMVSYRALFEDLLTRTAEKLEEVRK